MSNVKNNDVYNEIFYGYCFFEDGTYTPKVTLNSVYEAVNYVRLQMILQYEVKIVDQDDCIVIHAKEGKIIFPININININKNININE